MASAPRTTAPGLSDQAAEKRAGNHAAIAFVSIAIVSWMVDSSSVATEWNRGGYEFNWLGPWVLEGSSMIFVVLLFFGVREIEQRFPFSSSNRLVFIAVHVTGSLVFSVIHVAGMVMLRKALWPILFEQSYDFFTNPVADFLYEYRKDAMSYALMIFLLHLFRDLEFARLEAAGARAEARETRRITLKCGGRIFRFEGASFQYAKAAGNYVEARFGDTDRLARMTLAELEKQLVDAGVDAVRVHRSWLINQAAITEISPTGEGDVVLTLTNGARIPGSRRYRGRLKAA